MSGGSALQQVGKKQRNLNMDAPICGEIHNSVGDQKKLKPICKDPMMRKDAMSTRDLQELSFGLSYFEIPSRSELRRLIPSRYHLQIVSDIHALYPKANSNETNALPLLGKEIKRLGSRQGRSSQRWLFDAPTQRKIRLVTGCVPILKDGRILIISANRKPNWILPKGGWECDESMEESAVRESYEEAGVTGFLGSRLSEVTFEPRKLKQQRLSLGQPIDLNLGDTLMETSFSGPPSDDTSKFQTRSSGEFSSSGSDLSHLSDDTSFGSPEKTRSKSLSHPEVFTFIKNPTEHEDYNVTFDTSESSHVDPFELTNSDHSIVSPSQPPFSGAKPPVVSPCQLAFTEPTFVDETFRYTHIQMSLFPLYVSEVHDDWPEIGRLRRAVSIDEAITMLSSRPEFQSALVEVKERGLHLHPA